MPHDRRMTDLLNLGAEDFVSLTTFRRSGEGVATTVWVVRDDDALLVTTPGGSGKVKRLRNDSRVTVRPSSRSGKVPDDAPTCDGSAELRTDEATSARANALFRAKYGWQFRIALWFERRGEKRGKPGRVVVRIAPA